MAIQTITVNATASLTANGTSTATGSMTWITPSLPEEVATWSAINITGSWSWGGKGNITNLTINGTTVAADSNFNVSLATSAAPPIVLTCRGNNKNATGNNFRWTNLIVTYSYEIQQQNVFYIKKNNTWNEISKVYKKINSVWVEQTDIQSIFSTEATYIKGDV